MDVCVCFPRPSGTAHDHVLRCFRHYLPLLASKILLVADTNVFPGLQYSEFIVAWPLIVDNIRMLFTQCKLPSFALLSMRPPVTLSNTFIVFLWERYSTRHAETLSPEVSMVFDFLSCRIVLSNPSSIHPDIHSLFHCESDTVLDMLRLCHKRWVWFHFRFVFLMITAWLLV